VAAPAIGNHAAAAADTGVVEQQVDLVGLVTVGYLVAKPLDLRPVGDIGDVRRDAQPLRQSRRLAEPLRFRQAGRRDVAHRDIAGFRHQLADQLAAHSAAAAGDYRDPPSEFGHVYLPCFLAPIQIGPPRLPLRRWGRVVWEQCQVGKRQPTLRANCSKKSTS
jgi:hypothetical protein